jgi:hypothetical protein
MKSLKRKSVLYITIIGFAVLLTTQLVAQEKIRVFEIATPDFGQFNLRYKFGNEDRLFRISAINLLNISYSNKVNLSTTQNNFQSGIGLGVEYPRKLNDKMQFIYGAGLSASITSNNAGSKINGYGISAHSIVGFSYKLNHGLSIGAEIKPGVGYNSVTVNDKKTNTTALSFSNQNAMIMLGFAF